MKTIHNIKIISYIICSAVLLTACKDIVDYERIQKESDVSTGPPAINSITMVNRTTVITEADLSQLVMIQGTNLSGLKSIRFNDVEADLKQAYVKAKEIIVPVPRILPGTVSNKITITTNLGETSANLKIKIPQLVFKGLFNEFALPGDTTTITGDNFDLYKLNTKDAKVTFGSTEAKILEASQTSLTVIVPATIPVQEATVTVSTPELGQPLQVLYRHTGQILNIQNKLWQGEQWITDGKKLGDPKAINGNFSHLKGVTIGQWGWYDNVHGCNFPVQDQDIINNLGNYDLKFELNTEKDHPLSQMFIKFSMRFQIKYEWSLFDAGAVLNTYGQWQTITLDAKTVMGELFSNNDNFFSMAINPGVQTNLDFSLSTLRLVKKPNK